MQARGAMGPAWLCATALLLLLASARAGPATTKPAFRKCCPAGYQLHFDMRTCLPLPPPGRRPSAPTYSTEDAASSTPSSRGRRALEDWGWLPENMVITDADSLEMLLLEDLRREARDARRQGKQDAAATAATAATTRAPPLPRVEMGAPPPCASHDTELLFWDQEVQLISNGSLLVTQHRPDLFRPPSMLEAGSTGSSAAGDEGERSFLFPPGSFCMDRLTLSAVETVPLERRDDVGEQVVEAARADNATAPQQQQQQQDDDDVRHVILLCPCAVRRCVRKCCHPNSVLVVHASGDTECQHDRQDEHGDDQDGAVASAADANKARGAEAAREWGPSQHRHPDELDSGQELFMLHVLPHCANPEGRRFLLNAVSLFNSSQSGQFWIMDDGSAVVDSFGVDTSVPAGAFCGEVALDATTGLRAANLLVCADPGVLSSSTTARTFYGALAATGAAFLALTLLVHAALPELRRSLHSSNLMAHTGSLLMAYIALTVNSLATAALPHAACLALAFVMQFSFLAAFFWLNVMCVDISWAFSGLRLPQGSAAERDRKKFLWYSLYAWGGSSAITALTVAMNFLPVAGTHHALHPQIGVVSCWFKEKTTALIYFYGPMAFLLLANLVLFIYTAARILAVRKDTAILHKADNARSHSGAETQRLVLYVKLFGLMGLTWVTEIISWAAGGRNYYWYATDVINLLRAVFIFIIFCCKRKVLRLMLDRFGDAGGDTSGSRGGRSGAGPRTRGRGAGTMTSSLTFQQDARRLQHTASQDSSMTTVTSPTPTTTPDAIMLSVR